MIGGVGEGKKMCVFKTNFLKYIYEFHNFTMLKEKRRMVYKVIIHIRMGLEWIRQDVM